MPNRLSAQEPETLCEIYGENVFVPIGSPATNTNASSLGTTNFTGANLYIQGTLVVNVNVSFSGCVVRMGTGARIVTSGNVGLNIQNSYFFSCDDMWQGIVIQSPAMATVSGTEFEDALICFTIRSSLLQSFSDNTFNRNQVGMQVLVPFAPYPFHSNTFTCTSNLNAPLNTVTSRSGIEVLNTSADLITYKQGFNIFSALQCGILAERAFVWVDGASFAGMTAGGENFGGNPGGSGIIALGGSLDVNGSTYIFDENTACQFDFNDRAGIMSRGTNLNIRNSLFTRNQFGIDSRNNLDMQNISIEECEFRNLGISPLSSLVVNGIYLQRSNALEYSDISYNYFQTAAVSPARFIVGIQVIGVPSTGIFDVLRNPMENFSPRMVKGISINPGMADGFIVVTNKIEFHDVNSTLPDRFGIEIAGGSGFYNTVNWNEILGDEDIQSSNTFRCAFHILGSHDFDFCLNSTDFGYRGFHFAQVCNGTDFIENAIGQHDLGLHLGANAVIGFQTRTQNTWSTDAGTYGIMAALNDNPEWENSLFIVHSDDLNFMPSTALREPDAWFVEAEGSLTTCVETFAEIGLDSFDRKVALGNYQAPYPVHVWDAARRVYYKLLRFPDLSEEPEVGTFFGQIDTSSSGQFAFVDFKLWKAILMPEVVQDDLDDVRQIITGKSDSLFLLDSLLEIAFDSLVFAQKSVLMHDLHDLAEVDQQIREQAFDAREAALDTVSSLIENLPRTVAYEQTRADYLELIVRTWRGIDFTQGQIDTIRAMALAADSTVGLTAIDTRMLLPAGDSLWSELIDPSCSAGLSEERPVSGLDEKSEQSAIRFLTLQPNPANQQAQIRLSMPASGQAMLYDAMGRLVKVVRFVQSQNFSIETAGLNTGVYTCILRFEDGISLPQKLIIAH